MTLLRQLKEVIQGFGVLCRMLNSGWLVASSEPSLVRRRIFSGSCARVSDNRRIQAYTADICIAVHWLTLTPESFGRIASKPLKTGCGGGVGAGFARNSGLKIMVAVDPQET